MHAAGDVAAVLRREKAALADSAVLGAEVDGVQLERETGLNARNGFCKCKLIQAGIAISVSET